MHARTRVWPRCILALMISLGSTFLFAPGGLLAQEPPSRSRMAPPGALPAGEARVPQPPQQGPVPAPRIAERVTAPDGPVLGEAKLVTTAAWTQPVQPMAGKQFTVQAQLVNEGGLPSQAGVAFLVACDETPGGPSCPSKSSFSTTLPSIAPGKTIPVSVLLDAVWLPGKYRLAAGTDVIFLNDAVDLELVVGSSPSGTPSPINLKPESVFITKSPTSSDVTTQVPSGHAVKIWCPVRVDGTAYQQFRENAVFWGDPAWVLHASKTSSDLTFGSPLKVALIVDQQTVTVASIPKLGLNPASLEDAPHAPPNYISYSFDNTGLPHMVSIDWVFADEGQHNLRCIVDAPHTVKETNEGDNQVTSTVQVGLVKQHVQPQPTAAPAPIQVPQPPVSRKGPTAASAGVPTPSELAARKAAGAQGAARKPPLGGEAVAQAPVDVGALVPKPDLVITGVTGSHIKSEATAGSLVWKFLVEIRNTGLAEAGGSLLCAHADPAKAPQASQNPVPKLASQQSAKVEYWYSKPSWAFVEGGERTKRPLVFVADCQGSITEASEANNQYSVWLYWDPTETKTWEPAQ